MPSSTSTFSRHNPKAKMTYDDKPVLVAVLGVTGAGKTSFINRAANSDLVVGNDVHSCSLSLTACSPVLTLRPTNSPF
jgi:predicted GTPase